MRYTSARCLERSIGMIKSSIRSSSKPSECINNFVAEDIQAKYTKTANIQLEDKFESGSCYLKQKTCNLKDIIGNNAYKKRAAFEYYGQDFDMNMLVTLFGGYKRLQDSRQLRININQSGSSRIVTFDVATEKKVGVVYSIWKSNETTIFLVREIPFIIDAHNQIKVCRNLDTTEKLIDQVAYNYRIIPEKEVSCYVILIQSLLKYD